MKSVAILIFGITLIISCKKSGSDSDVSLKVKTVTYTTTSSSFNSTNAYNITYNTNDEITGRESITDPGNYSTFQPAGNAKNILQTYSGSLLFIHREAFLNPSTLLVDSVYEINANLKDTTKTKFHYNNASQVIGADEILHSHFGVIYNNRYDYTYDNKGNLIQEVQLSSGVNYTKVYTYGNDLPYLEISPSGHFPIISKNHPVKMTYTSPFRSYDVFHEYKFDDRGRLIADIATTSEDDKVYTSAYTYY